MVRKLRATIAQLLHNIDSIRSAAHNALAEFDHIRDSLWHIQGDTEALRTEVSALRSALRARAEAPAEPEPAHPVSLRTVKALVRPGPVPTTPAGSEAGETWHYLTVDGCKTEPPTYIYRRTDGSYGTEVDGSFRSDAMTRAEAERWAEERLGAWAILTIWHGAEPHIP
jgi:hypothetical protein